MPGVVQLYDSTLRDGSQMEGISFSLEDKLLIAQKLDEIGIHFIEGGFPGSNPKDAEFFVRARDLELRQARIVAFGGTRRAGLSCDEDPNIQSLVHAHTQAICFVGKASARQVRDILETTPEENLSMIADSVAYMRAIGKQVFFDAEHFFDGFFDDPGYSLQVLRTAHRAGAEVAVLCDTNGGTITPKLLEAIGAVRETGVPFGIHVHDDTGLGVANTLAAFEAGAVQLRQRQPHNGHRQPESEARRRLRQRRAAFPTNRGVAFRQRAGQSCAELAGAVRRPERIRAQGGLPRGGDRQGRLVVPAHRPGDRWQRPTRAHLRAFRAAQYPCQAGRAGCPHPSEWRRDEAAPPKRQDNGESRLPV